MALSPETRDKLMTRQHRDPVHRALQARPAQPVHPGRAPLQPSLPNMVGEAFTLRYMPAREDLNPLDVFHDRAHPQRKAVEECPPGAVLVIDSRKDARAASAGGILVGAADEARRRRRGDRRRLPRRARDRDARHPRLPPPPLARRPT